MFAHSHLGLTTRLGSKFAHHHGSGLIAYAEQPIQLGCAPLAPVSQCLGSFRVRGTSPPVPAPP